MDEEDGVMRGIRPVHHPGRAVAAGLLNGLLLVALPYGLARAAADLLRSGGTDLLGGRAAWDPGDVAPVIAWIEGLERLILLVGGGAALLAALTALFARGTLPRLAFGLARQAARFAWLALVLGGGLWTLRFGLPGSPFGGFGGLGAPGRTAVELALDLSPIFALLYAALGTTAVYLAAECVLWRRGLRAAAGAPPPLPPPPPPP